MCEGVSLSVMPLLSILFLRKQRMIPFSCPCQDWTMYVANTPGQATSPVRGLENCTQFVCSSINDSSSQLSFSHVLVTCMSQQRLPSLLAIQPQPVAFLWSLPVTSQAFSLSAHCPLRPVSGSANSNQCG